MDGALSAVAVCLDVEPEASASAAAELQVTSSDRRLMMTTCYGCGRPIKDRWLLRAVDRSWHESCLRCSYCQCALAAVGSTLFTRADLLLCRRDYLRHCYYAFNYYIRLRLIPGFLHNVANVKQTRSKLRAHVVHVYFEYV